MLERRQPYTHAKPTTGRVKAGLFRVEPRLIPLTEPVDRDPCQRCGVRHDIGCKHTRAPIGMML